MNRLRTPPLRTGHRGHLTGQGHHSAAFLDQIQFTAGRYRRIPNPLAKIGKWDHDPPRSGPGRPVARSAPLSSGGPFGAGGTPRSSAATCKRSALVRAGATSSG